MNQQGQKSLSFHVAVWTAAVIAVAMAVYAVFQYFALPGVTVWELVVHHLWHVLVLGALIHILCCLVFRRVLLRPLQQIYLHLYGVGTGRLQELELSTRIRELQTIVNGVNVMIQRMQQGYDPEALDHFKQALGSLRELVRSLAPSEQETAASMLDQLANLERALLSIVRTAPEKAETLNF